MKNYILGIVTGFAVLISGFSFWQINAINAKANLGVEAYNFIAAQVQAANAQAQQQSAEMPTMVPETVK